MSQFMIDTVYDMNMPLLFLSFSSREGPPVIYNLLRLKFRRKCNEAMGYDGICSEGTLIKDLNIDRLCTREKYDMKGFIPLWFFGSTGSSGCS
uniref:Uncharacterized protein n=1 Tax=Lepeophtheirus salmonis TaxID=72036 RepID=A0A0K2T7S9_LEPSM